MKLYVASLVLLVAQATAVSGYGYGGGSFGGNFGSAVSGSSAQHEDDRYGNSNQLHGKHVHEYAYERMRHLERQRQEEQPQEQPKEKEKGEQPVQQQKQPQPQPQPGPPSVENSRNPFAEPEEVKHRVSQKLKTIPVQSKTPLSMNDKRYGSATMPTKPRATTQIPVVSGPSATTATRIDNRYGNTIAPPQGNAPPHPGVYGGGGGGYGGGSFGGNFGTISGSSAQYVDDRYGNTNQLHGKHVHDYAYERMRQYGMPSSPPPPADSPEGDAGAQAP